MKVTRERKIYAAVLGLTVLGFALDRTIYGGSTEAAPESGTTDMTVVQATPAVSAGTATAEEPSLAARLVSSVSDPTIDSSSIRNPFSRLLPWVASAPAASVEAAPNLGDLFASRHTLTATMGAGQQNGIAIIDGSCVRIGHTLDGFRLVSVDRHSAVLESGSTRVKLALKADVALVPQ